MRFRRAPRPTPFEETTRKRAAFLRKQRRELDPLPLFSSHTATEQHSVVEETAAVPNNGPRSNKYGVTKGPHAGAKLAGAYSVFPNRSATPSDHFGGPALIRLIRPTSLIFYIRSLSVSSTHAVPFDSSRADGCPNNPKSYDVR